MARHHNESKPHKEEPGEMPHKKRKNKSKAKNKKTKK